MKLFTFSKFWDIVDLIDSGICCDVEIINKLGIEAGFLADVRAVFKDMGIEFKQHSFEINNHDTTRSFSLKDWVKLVDAETLIESKRKIESSNEVYDKIQAIIQSKGSYLYLVEHKLEFYPRKIFLLNGEHQVVGESDNRIYSIALTCFEGAREFLSRRKFSFSSAEIRSYIKHVKDHEESSERLILKIKDATKISTEGQQEFISNPVSIKNYDQEIIWAATVDLGDDFFDWLSCIIHQVEIISSDRIKHLFIEYCNRELKSAA